MENATTARQAEDYLVVMEQLCKDYTDALMAYDKAKEAGDPEGAARLERVVIEKSGVMQACTERFFGGSDPLH